MKRNYKKSIIFFCLFCLFCFCIALSGCTYNFEDSQDGKFSFGVSKIRKDAFCFSCNWDGGDTSFVIPDEFMGYKVTTLGGYAGRGVPCPFGVRIDRTEIYPGDDVYLYDGRDDAFWEDIDDTYDILKFSMHLGVNLVNLEYIDGKTYIVRRIEAEDEEIIYDILCKIVYSFTVDEANPKLYAENGKLYYRATDELVTEFFYE